MSRKIHLTEINSYKTEDFLNTEIRFIANLKPLLNKTYTNGVA